MKISGDKLRCFFIFDTSLVMIFFAYDGCSVNSDYTGWKNGKEKSKIKR